MNKLQIHVGPYHPHHAQKLPQFTEIPPMDLNEILGYKDVTKENVTIIYESHPEKAPEEFEGFTREIDESIEEPPQY